MKITHHYNVRQIITFTTCLVPATTLGMEKKKRQNVPALQSLLSNNHRKDADTENDPARGRTWRPDATRTGGQPLSVIFPRGH